MLPYNIKDLISSLDEGKSYSYRLFYGQSVANGCCSQWYPCKFVIGGITYSSAEQWMMACKARTFNDEATLKSILESDDPGLVKSLGRAVKNYDDDKWNKVRFDFVVEGNLRKFSQDPSLTSYLLSTGDDIFVEASPYDKIWGIGMKTSDPRALNPREWDGLNLLGFAITKVRDVLRHVNYLSLKGEASKEA
jgi:ribA/ribD-fused uncharacterized protein